MFITNLTQIGEIFLLLSQEWRNGTVHITIKKGGKKPFDNVLVDTIIKVNNIYKFLLENWQEYDLQVFCEAP